MQIRLTGEATNLPPGDYEKGFKIGAAQAYRLTRQWLAEDVLKEDDSAEAEVEQPGT